MLTGTNNRFGSQDSEPDPRGDRERDYVIFSNGAESVTGTELETRLGCRGNGDPKPRHSSRSVTLTPPSALSSAGKRCRSSHAVICSVTAGWLVL